MGIEILSPSSQVASHLRDQILKNRWMNELPGTPALSSEFGVDRKTVMAAMIQLENEGLIKAQGPGRRRKVIVPKTHSPNCLNIQILPYEEADRQLPHFLEASHRIRQLGHTVSPVPKSMKEFGMDVNRISKYAESSPADAWILLSASKEILEWFSDQPTPAFAIFGRRRQVNIASAGPDKQGAFRTVIRRLAALGHRRIVYLVREERRKPFPGALETHFLDELESNRIPSGPYNLPDWEDDPDSFHRCLESLFQFTPPTAIITDEVQFFIAAHHHLSQRNLVIPTDVSLISCDTHPLFDWCQPPISHIRWDPGHAVDHCLHWVGQLAHGKNERKTAYTPVEFFEGGTIGPAKG